MKVQTLIDQAQLLTDNDNYERAYELLKTAHETDGGNAEVLERLALVAQTLSRCDEAITYWEKLIEVDPNSLVAYTELQDIYFNTDKHKYYLTRAKVKVLQGNMNQAISDYKKAIDNTSDEEQTISTRFLMAKSYEFLGKITNAIDEYYKILDYKNNLSVFYKLAELHSIDDKHAAIDILYRAVEAYPDELGFKEVLARLLIETSQLDEALKYVQTDLNKIKIFLMQGENDKAYKLLTTMEDTSSSQYDILFAEYYFNKKDFESCKKQIEKFKEKEPDSPLIYQMLALINEENAEMDQAHYNWGKYYMKKGDSQMALNEYLIAHNINDKNIGIIREIINIYQNNGEKHALLEFYEKTLAIEPENEQALEELAKFYMDMHEFKNAIRYFEQLSELNNKNYSILKDMAICYEKTKNNILAKEYYQKYLDKAPLTPENEQLRDKINGMSNESIQEDDGFLNKLLSFFSK